GVGAGTDATLARQSSAVRPPTSAGGPSGDAPAPSAGLILTAGSTGTAAMLTDSPQRLRGRRVLITGATSGVGLAAAERFAAEGARLALVARTREALERADAEHGLDALLLPADLADAEAVERTVAEAARALGGLDLV